MYLKEFRELIKDLPDDAFLRFETDYFGNKFCPEIGGIEYKSHCKQLTLIPECDIRKKLYLELNKAIKSLNIKDIFKIKYLIESKFNFRRDG